MQKNRNWSSERRRWFYEQYESRVERTANVFPHLDLDTVEFRLLRSLSSCTAKTDAQFLSWSKKQVAKMADSQQLPKENKRRGVKPFIYETHGDRSFIRMSDVLVWVVPSSWLPIARSLWPCHIRRNSSGPYINKKVRRQTPTGSWTKTNVALHHLFLGCDCNDLVDAKDGNLLNFYGDNLAIRETKENTKSRYERGNKKMFQKRASSHLSI